MLTLIIINIFFQIQKHEHRVRYSSVIRIFTGELTWDVGRVE